MDELLKLAKSKLNITWTDDGTDGRVLSILEDALPTVSNMVGLNFVNGAPVEKNGDEFDFSQPSMERNVLLNYVAYEWNHQENLFREAYWQEIAACRQKHALESESDAG